MTCRDIIEFLTDYAAGTVNAEERAVFEAHLAICPPCVAYLRTYQVTVQLGKGALGGTEEATDPMPEELVTAILAARKSGA